MIGETTTDDDDTTIKSTSGSTDSSDETPTIEYFDADGNPAVGPLTPGGSYFDAEGNSLIAPGSITTVESATDIINAGGGEDIITVAGGGEDIITVAGGGEDTINAGGDEDIINPYEGQTTTISLGGLGDDVEVPLTQSLVDAGYTSTGTTGTTSNTTPATTDTITTVEDSATPSLTQQQLLQQEMMDKYGFDLSQINFASGGQIKNSINTLDQYAQPLPMGNMSLNNMSLGNMYAEGGMVQDDKVDALMQNPVIQEKMSEGDRGLLQQASFVLLGRIDDDGSIISEFVDKFGSDALDMLKGELLPNMQQQGMIEGEGGGMDDMVDGVIGDQERVAVSPGEYIVPADVVGDLGDGNSEQGARIMDDFLSRVRTEKHGTDQQPSPVNLNNVMPS